MLWKGLGLALCDCSVRHARCPLWVKRYTFSMSRDDRFTLDSDRIAASH